MGLRHLGKVAEVVQVTPTDIVLAAAGCEPVAPVLADGFEHPVARLARVARPPKEALADQRGDSVECVEPKLAARIADGLSRLIHAAELAAQAALREANASPRLRAPS